MQDGSRPGGVGAAAAGLQTCGDQRGTARVGISLAQTNCPAASSPRRRRRVFGRRWSPRGPQRRTASAEIGRRRWVWSDRGVCSVLTASGVVGAVRRADIHAASTGSPAARTRSPTTDRGREKLAVFEGADRPPGRRRRRAGNHRLHRRERSGVPPPNDLLPVAARAPIRRRPAGPPPTPSGSSPSWSPSDARSVAPVAERHRALVPGRKPRYQWCPGRS